MLEVTDLSVTYPPSVPALSGITFSLQEGETLGIVGESGAGKSALANAILRLNPAAQIHGSIRFLGQELLTCTEKELIQVRGKEIGMVFQDPLSSLNPIMTIGAQIRENATVDAEELLVKVGIDRPKDRLKQYPHELSGGMRQRVLLAIAIARSPRLLIADEATTAVDAQTQESLLTLVKDLKLTLLWISHDLKLVSRISDRILVLQKGKIVEQGPTHQLLHHPSHPYTKQLLHAAPPKIPSHNARSNNLLSIRALTKFYERPVLENLSFDLKEGEVLGIVGRSGIGKSTLARILAGLEEPTSGEILFQGHPLANLKQRSKAIQMVYQDPSSSLNPRMKVKSLLEEPTSIHHLPSRAQELLQMVSLPTHYKDKYPHQLSGGEKQRVAIARALALNPKLLLLDEAVSSLDALTRNQILTLLASLKQTFGLSYLFISHDLEAVEALSDRILSISKDESRPL